MFEEHSPYISYIAPHHIYHSIKYQFLVRLHGEYNTSLALWKHHVKYIIAKLSIRKLGSSSVLIIFTIALLALMKI